MRHAHRIDLAIIIVVSMFNVCAEKKALIAARRVAVGQ